MIGVDQVGSTSSVVPRRLAQLRLQVLDLVLSDLEHMRLDGDRTLPPSVRALIADLARAHDCTLEAVADAPSPDITAAECQLLAAQEQIMLELANLGGGKRTWAAVKMA
jgi:hypothetical protein